MKTWDKKNSPIWLKFLNKAFFLFNRLSHAEPLTSELLCPKNSVKRTSLKGFDNMSPGWPLDAYLPHQKKKQTSSHVK